jgi:transcriptional antiterminator Rof (Rho-off)
MTDYTPVDCGLHSSYELAIMQHQLVRLSWLDNEASVHTDTVLPTDLVTRNGEEFMRITRAGGDSLDIRLDHIRRFEPAR